MKRVIGEPQGHLLRGLLRLFRENAPSTPRQFPQVIVESFDTEAWGSLTFSGHRHHVSLVVKGAQAKIPSLEGLVVVGAIVADVRIVAMMPGSTGIRLDIAVLTIDEKG